MLTTIETTIDLTRIPLQDFKKKDDAITEERTLQDMLYFYKSLQHLLYKESHSVFIAEQLQVANLINSILSRYKSITFRPKLIGKSFNSKANPLSVLNLQDQTEKVFLKFQLEKEKDDIRLDACNAFLIQHLMPNSPHYLEPIDLFKTFVSTDDHWYLDDYIGAKLRIIIKDARIHIEPEPEPSKFPFVVDKRDIIETYNDVVKEDGFKVATVLSAKQIIGPSLNSIIYTMDDTNYRYYVDKLNTLFKSMIDLGKYGFVHNDAHISNILFNTEKQEFCLIDYGSMSFYPEYLNVETQKMVNDYIQWSFLQTNSISLREFIKEYHKKNTIGESRYEYTDLLSTYFYINYRTVLNMGYEFKSELLLIKSLYLFDISTITLGICDSNMVFRTKQKVHTDVKGLFTKHFQEKDILDITRDFIIIRQFNSLYQWIETTPFVDELKRDGLDILLPGILWASCIFSASYEADSTDKIFYFDERRGVLIIDRHLLVNKKYMYYSYQYRRAIFYSCRTTLLNYLQRAIEPIIKIFNLNPIPSQGGMMASRTSRIPSSVRSVRSQYLRESSRTTSMKPSLPNGQLESVAEYNRTETPPAELTDWLKDYHPLPRELFDSLESFVEATRQKNARFHPLVEELKKYKPFFKAPKVSKETTRTRSNGSRSR